MSQKKSLPNLRQAEQKGTLRCPDCDTVMTPYKCEHIVIDKCESCGGIWFDPREIGVFKKSLGQFNLTLLEPIGAAGGDETYTISHCPRCQEMLHDVVFSYDRKVRTRKCESCGGLWFPPHYLLNFIESARVSQVIEPSVRALADEIVRMHASNRRYGFLKWLGNFLMTPVRGWGWW